MVWVIWVRLFVQSLIKGGMDKLKKFLSFFGFCLLVGAVFNFFDLGSISIPMAVPT